MELLILDKDFQEIGTLELFSSLQWTRRYYQPGEFEVYFSLENFNMFDEGVFLFRRGYELAVIESVKVVRSYTGEISAMASGRFIESILNDRVLTAEQSFIGTREDIARDIVNANLINPVDPKRKVKALNLGELSGESGASVTIGTENEYVGDVLYEILKENEMSHSIRYDYLTDQLFYEVWKGKDRTDAQEINSHAVFSDNLENVLDDTYSIDRSDYKNFCYVVGKDNITVEVDKVTPGERRRELVVKTYEEDSSIMTSEGHMQLGRNKIVEIFDGKILSKSNFIYRKDYDLGDLVTFSNTRIGKMANKRITEIKEIYEDGNVEIYPIFGDDYITINQKIKREVNR